MALIYSIGLLTDRLLQSQNTNKTHILPDQFLFGSGFGGQSHSLIERGYHQEEPEPEMPR
jgi:hypothetical protein